MTRWPKALVWLLPALLALLLPPSSPCHADEAGAPATEAQQDGTTEEFNPPRVAPNEPVDLVFCLDVSGDMYGDIFIGRAKGIAAGLIKRFVKDVGRPDVRVGFVTFSDLPPNTAPRIVLPLTGDLRVAEATLRAIKTTGKPFNGDRRPLGWAIQKSAQGMAWRDGFKAIWVLGRHHFGGPTNTVAGMRAGVATGPFDGSPYYRGPYWIGPVDHREAARNAARRGIIVNAVQCDQVNETAMIDEIPAAFDGWDAVTWVESACYGGGSYLHFGVLHQEDRSVLTRISIFPEIVPWRERAFSDFPYEKSASELLAKLQDTYWAYAPLDPMTYYDGRMRAFNAAMGAIFFGSGINFHRLDRDHREWDLADGVAAGLVNVREIDRDLLPRRMRRMTPNRQEEYLAEQRLLRRDLLQELTDLERDYFSIKRSARQAWKRGSMKAQVNLPKDSPLRDELPPDGVRDMP